MVGLNIMKQNIKIFNQIIENNKELFSFINLTKDQIGFNNHQKKVEDKIKEITEILEKTKYIFCLQYKIINNLVFSYNNKRIILNGEWLEFLTNCFVYFDNNKINQINLDILDFLIKKLKKESEVADV